MADVSLSDILPLEEAVVKTAVYLGEFVFVVVYRVMEVPLPVEEVVLMGAVVYEEETVV